MAYAYTLRFQIKPEKISKLQIGSSLERVLGYLRALLPSQDGFITCRALYSLEDESSIELLLESVWDTWENIQKHRNSTLSEAKVLIEFGQQIKQEDLHLSIYKEVE